MYFTPGSWRESPEHDVLRAMVHARGFHLIGCNHHDAVPMLFDWLSQHVRSNWPHKKFADGITWFPPGKSPLEIVAHLTSATPTEHVLARGDATRVLRNRDQFEVDQHRILALCAETNEQDRDAFACAETLMRILITIHHHIASEREWV